MHKEPLDGTPKGAEPSGADIARLHHEGLTDVKCRFIRYLLTMAW